MGGTNNKKRGNKLGSESRVSQPDGSPVDRLSETILPEEVELQAYAETPQYQQALQVATLNKERNDKAVRPLRNLWGRMKRERRKLDQAPEERREELAAAFAKWEGEFRSQVAAMRKLAAEYEERIYQANQPKPRHYRLVRVAKAPAKGAN